MNATRRMATMGLLIMVLNSHQSVATAQGTAFTYQGRLSDVGIPANGSYDLRFTLYDAGTNGSPQGPILTNTATAVSNGLFTVTLDFGNQFPGADRWLELAVRTNGADSFIPLSPLQPLGAVPYAITAGSVAPGGLPSGTYTNAVVFNNANNQFAGNGVGLTNLPFGGLSAAAQAQFTNVAAGVAAAATAGMVTNTFTFTPQGGNDSTAYIQTNLAKGGSFIFSPGVYYVSNLVLTNFTTIYGYNATLAMNSGATGFLLYEPSNVIQDQIFGLALSGGAENTAWETGGNLSSIISDPAHPWLGDGSGGPFSQLNREAGSFTDRSGIYLNAGGLGTVQDMRVTGFPGYAFFLINTNSTGRAMSSQKMRLLNCTAQRNYIGFWPSGWSWDYDPTGEAADMNCEYFSINGCQAVQNTVGISVAAGNINIVGNEITDNFIGLVQGAAHNAGHGLISANTINHNVIGYWGAGNSQKLQNNAFYAQTGVNIYCDACPSMEIAGNTLWDASYNASVTMTNSWAPDSAVQMFFYNNIYQGTWSNQVAVGSINFEQQGEATATYVSYWGNASKSVQGDTDGQPIGQNFNAANLTNLNAAQLTGTLPAANLPGITTNVSTAGITFYITNGLIMRVTTP